MKQLRLPRILDELWRLMLIVIGAVLAGLGFSLFQVPYNIAAGGVSGIAILINHFTGWPISVMYLVMNVPLFVLGFFYLGRWRFLISTALAVLLFSFTTGVGNQYLPTVLAEWPITDNILLSAIYAGLIGGIGGGLLYLAGATMGGTAIIGRIIQVKTGLSLSQIYLFVDGAIVLAAGIVFGWEIALYAMLTLLLSGQAADFVMEGPSRARTAMVITTEPEAITRALIAELGRGVSYWDAVGGYTGEKRTVVMCTIYRPQVGELKRVVASHDPHAFVIIGTTQQALGEGFTELRQRG
ncbi:MAG: YitT family protein [Caldilinea sp.]|nr:YitT family protein [Caldilinea sp.]MCB0068486.1 YitT family protein [Caldilineaceae bacterium]MCB0054592.1 YitT family protein [Caldilinea sp.]MCB0136810.1 YitT family protein [Caldilineaceae bacterium]MCB9115015.1 YitT family protein [Caldilineaceae bacterium]